MATLFDRLRTLPGVGQVGGVSNLPLGEHGDCADGKFLLLDRQPQFDLTKPEDDARLEHLLSPLQAARPTIAWPAETTLQR